MAEGDRVMELPQLTGRQVVMYYRIVEFKIIEWVKKGWLQPYSDIGEPIKEPLPKYALVEIEDRKHTIDYIGLNINGNNSKNPNFEEDLLYSKSRLEWLTRSCQRSWDYVEESKLFPLLLSYYYKTEDIEKLITPTPAIDTADAGEGADSKQIPPTPAIDTADASDGADSKQISPEVHEFLREAGQEAERLYSYVIQELRLFDKEKEDSEWRNVTKSQFEGHRREWNLLKEKYVDDPDVFITIPGDQNKRDFVGKILAKILIDNGYGIHPYQKLFATYNALKKNKLK